MAKSSGNVIVNGNIDSAKIYAAHSQVKDIVSSFKDVNLNVSKITNQIKDVWVGEGRNEFESQYNLLISKIDDFGDTLQEIYDALVQAEADYETADNDLKQDFKAAIEE